VSKLTSYLDREHKALVAYVRRRIDDASLEEAEDIVQDVAVSLFERADPTAPIQDLAAFIYRAIRNRIIDRFRRRRPTLSLDDVPLASGDNPQKNMEKRETLELLFKAVEILSEEEKAVVLATEFDGWSFRELAEEWKIPLGTLLARKSRALQKMKKHLTGQT